MALPYEEQKDLQFHWLYELGIEQGAKVMIAFPLLQMCICLGRVQFSFQLANQSEN